jgi:predicted regulator of Ras-like GTPase activity (Roadblock/LC7/MglB family)
MQKQRFSLTRLFAVVGVAIACAGGAQALQTVTPRSAPTGGNDLTATGSPVGTHTFANNGSFTFYGTYSDNSGSPESGLGLKLKYNGALISVVVSEEYTKCRIAGAQRQNIGTGTEQWVMGWIDTSVRSAGAVGWPDLADTAGGGANPACLNPGNINTETAAASAAGLKLFKGVVTWVGSPAVGTTATITLDDDNNYSYANAGSGFTDKSFTVQAGAPQACNLDVDGSGSVTALVDGLLIQRALNGNITDANVVAGVPFPGSATRTTGAAIRAYLATFVNVGTQIGSTGIGGGATVLDVDGSATTNALVDGLLIKRALNTNITEANVVAGVSVVAGTTGGSVRTALNNRCGLSLPVQP